MHKQGNVLVITTPYTLELIEYTIVLVQIAQLATQVIVDLYGSYGPAFHVDVPDLQGKVVSREDVPSVMAELDIGDGRYDLGEERPRCWVFFLFETCFERGR